MACMLQVRYYGEDGHTCGSASNIFLPDYLDWMPIRLKAFWFLTRGSGPPGTKNALLESQGEQVLVTVKTPLRDMKHTQLKEAEHGLEELVIEFARKHGISRAPRNQ